MSQQLGEKLDSSSVENPSSDFPFFRKGNDIQRLTVNRLCEGPYVLALLEMAQALSLVDRKRWLIKEGFQFQWAFEGP